MQVPLMERVAVLFALVACAAATSPTRTFIISGESIAQQSDMKQLEHRPLKLPVVRKNAPCPVATGDKASVAPAKYIFCSGCFWYGKGPVFLALSWSDQQSTLARFALTRVPHVGNEYRVKTPWVSRPDFEGAILIRGQRLDGGRGAKIGFSSSGSDPAESLELNASARDRPDTSQWSFWPTSLLLRGAGCYGVQIDTRSGADIVIFEATGPT